MRHNLVILETLPLLYIQPATLNWVWALCWCFYPTEKATVWQKAMEKVGGELKQCGNCLNSLKTGSWEECDRNLKRMGKKENDPFEETKPQKCLIKTIPEPHWSCSGLFLFCILVVIGFSFWVDPCIHSEASERSHCSTTTQFHCETPRKTKATYPVIS